MSQIEYPTEPEEETSIPAGMERALYLKLIIFNLLNPDGSLNVKAFVQYRQRKSPKGETTAGEDPTLHITVSTDTKMMAAVEEYLEWYLRDSPDLLAQFQKPNTRDIIVGSIFNILSGMGLGRIGITLWDGLDYFQVGILTKLIIMAIIGLPVGKVMFAQSPKLYRTSERLIPIFQQIPELQPQLVEIRQRALEASGTGTTEE